MKPPQRPKRPSARPSARPGSVPPPANVRPESERAPDVTDSAPLQRPAEKGGPAGKEKKKHRVAVRRSSLPPAPQVLESDAGARPVPAEANAPAAPKAPRSEAATGAPSSLTPAPPGPWVDEDDSDIWGEAHAGPSVPSALGTPEILDEASSALANEIGDAGAGAVSRLARSRRQPRREQALVLGSAQALLSTDYYFRQYGAHGIRSLTADVDEFGLDPHAEERARPVLEALCKRYFRVTVDGAQHLPHQGRVLMVANRAGALPWDGLVLRTALRMARPTLQPVRWLAEDSVFHYPFLGMFMNRLGAVRACPENAERLLTQDRLVAVFPEGAQGSSKLFKDRYRLQRFGRGGYVKLALKVRAPIVPTAIIGAEEVNPLLARSRFLGRALGGSYLPITPTFPWLGVAGLLPAPVKWRIVVGEPVDISNYGPKSADDALLVHRLNEQVRAIMQGLIDQARSARGSVLFG